MNKKIKKRFRDRGTCRKQDSEGRTEREIHTWKERKRGRGLRVVCVHVCAHQIKHKSCRKKVEREEMAAMVFILFYFAPPSNERINHIHKKAHTYNYFHGSHYN